VLRCVSRCGRRPTWRPRGPGTLARPDP